MPSRNLTESQLEELRSLMDSPAAYYVKLASYGETYGNLALGVVGDTPASGSIARAFCESVAVERGIPMTATSWPTISRQLARADFQARERAFQAGEPSLDLKVNAIHQYHIEVFALHDLPPEAWTAYVPLKLVGESGEDELWEKMKSFGWGQELLAGVSPTLNAILSSAGGSIGAILTSFVNGNIGGAIASQLVQIANGDSLADVWLRNLLLSRAWTAGFGAGTDVREYKQRIAGGLLIGGNGVSLLEEIKSVVIGAQPRDENDDLRGEEGNDQIFGGLAPLKWRGIYSA